MLNIKKGSEPEKLARYRKLPDADWDGPGFTPVKEDIRKALYKEQRGLCAYCMCKLPKPTKANALELKIEHYYPRKKCTGKLKYKILEYKNLLLCCDGGERSDRYGERTCDSAKGEKLLEAIPNPASAHDVQSEISYSSDGSIVCPSKWSKDIKTLGLNSFYLRINRLRAKNCFIKKYCQAQKAGKKTKKAKLRSRLMQAKSSAMPYLGIILDYLQKEVNNTD